MRTAKESLSESEWKKFLGRRNVGVTFLERSEMLVSRYGVHPNIRARYVMNFLGLKPVEFQEILRSSIDRKVPINYSMTRRIVEDRREDINFPACIDTEETVEYIKSEKPCNPSDGLFEWFCPTLDHVAELLIDGEKYTHKSWESLVGTEPEKVSEVEPATPSALPESGLRPVSGTAKLLGDPDSTLIFTYGSLLSASSFSRTVRKRRKTLQCVPAKLSGYRAVWSIPHKKPNYISTEEVLDDDQLWLSLVIEPADDDDIVPGAVIRVSGEELEQLKFREKNYVLRDISRSLSVEGSESSLEPVYVFAPKDKASSLDHSVETPFAIRKQYLDSVTAGLKSIGLEPSFEIPANTKIVEAEDANQMLERHWSALSAEEILTEKAEFERHLWDRGCVVYIGDTKRPIAATVRPLVFSRAVYDRMLRSAEATISLVTKASSVMLGDEELSNLSGYSDRDLELARKTEERGSLMPSVARVDMTVRDGSIEIFEANCDSPGGIFHLDALTQYQQRIMERLGGVGISPGRIEKLTDAVKGAIFDRWNEFCERNGMIGSSPRGIAIVESNWREQRTLAEFLHFQDEFNREGYPTIINDPRKLRVTEDGLVGRRQVVDHEFDFPIDLVYKRVLWSDLRKAELEGGSALFRAFEEDSACVVNSFGARITGNKLMLAIAKEPDFEDRLARCDLPFDDVERDTIERAIPETRIWRNEDPDLVNRVLGNYGDYVLKSFHGHGGSDVLIGSAISTPRQKFMDRLKPVQSIVQRRIPHGSVRIPQFDGDDISWDSMPFIVGVYVVNGKAVAAEAKVSTTIPVNLTQGGYRTAVYRSDD